MVRRNGVWAERAVVVRDRVQTRRAAESNCEDIVRTGAGVGLTRALIQQGAGCRDFLCAGSAGSREKADLRPSRDLR